MSEVVNVFASYAPELLNALILTLEVTFLSFAIGLAGGVAIAISRASTPKPIKILITAFVELVRGTPMVVQLFFIYYALPSIGIKLDPFTASVFAMGLNSAVYQSEYWRTAIGSIPKTQWEAAYSLGLSTFGVLANVVLPQALRIAIPLLSNELIYLLKFSSIAYFVALPELVYTGKWIASKTFAYIEIYTIIAIFYIVITMILSEILVRLEKKLSIPGITIKRI
ncbi:amino acid ABC transporter permease [Ignisphaera sp. 4213-co]|uniref:Amino acid ABC transporter permease n=1 Tax=Ignisphaera cupida TaxID=3050454 RepID=A0ABD4Z7C9_9CREN|nr:amino acid ABC transporter permease [Ignisphaera sp. 4213-co]MDK6028847.1 amino acid ABC transporter permease [Ignisphaera sp. 4213-co]